MATTAARRRGAAAAMALAMAMLPLGSCIGPPTTTDEPAVVPAPAPPTTSAADTTAVPSESTAPVRRPAPGRDRPRPPAGTRRARNEPAVNVGLGVGAGSVTLGGGDGFMLREADGSLIGRVMDGGSVRVAPRGRTLIVTGLPGGATASARSVTVSPSAAGGLLRVGAREYRGELSLMADRTGLTIINRVGLEAYIAGVVAAEMGRREAMDFEALRAQAVVSRTYALRNMGRWRAVGFDFYATVADQVYAGAPAADALAVEAAESTSGLVLTVGGAPIDAFFFSTCGGRTAEGTEIFRGATGGYLRSISDTDPSGSPYCRISPRYRWTEEWSGADLRTTLRRTLPATTRIAAERVAEVRDVRVADRTGSGRVGRLAITLQGSEVEVDGPVVRQTLRAPSGEILRSNAFSIVVHREGRRVTRLVAEGAGAGHGVGMCQWGAIGRARAGQDFRRILAAYYHGVDLERRY